MVSYILSQVEGLSNHQVRCDSFSSADGAPTWHDHLARHNPVSKERNAYDYDY